MLVVLNYNRKPVQNTANNFWEVKIQMILILSTPTSLHLRMYPIQFLFKKVNYKRKLLIEPINCYHLNDL